MKRFIAIILTISLLICTFSFMSLGISEDMFDNSHNVIESETITVDNITYRLEYLQLNSKRITHVINLTDNTRDVIYYDEEKQIVFLNETPVAYIENVPITNSRIDASLILSSNGWVYHDTSNTRITWAMGVGVAVVAGVIATVIPGVTKLGVIAKIGFGALSVIAASSSGGTVRCVTYTQVLLDGSVQFRHDWTFIASTGDSYGPYSSYQL